LPPVYARGVAENESCRADALAEAGVFDLATLSRRASTRHAQIGNLTFMFYKVRPTQDVFTPAARTIFASD